MYMGNPKISFLNLGYFGYTIMSWGYAMDVTMSDFAKLGITVIKWDHDKYLHPGMSDIHL